MLTDDMGRLCRELRKLPHGADNNILCSRETYEEMIVARKESNSYPQRNKLPLPAWDELEVYAVLENENCLEGVMCPKCENTDSFRIFAIAPFEVTDDGADYEEGDIEWDGNSRCDCKECGYEALLRDFKTEEDNGS